MFSSRTSSHVIFCLTLIVSSSALAGGRLAATGGVTQIEGSAGGGLTPWALIAGTGTRDELRPTAFCTRVKPDDFRLDTCGAALGWHDRVEVSYARQSFDLGTTVPGHSIGMDVVGLKVKVLGDAITAQDVWYPQVAIGLQFKHNRDFDFVPRLLGAKDASGVDVYVSATKLYLAGIAGRNVLLNATLRATRGNQFGILGFGGDRHDGYTLQPELSAGVFLTDHVIAGSEYRAKPDNLSVFKEDDAWDAFLAWVPNKKLSLTIAAVDLGTIADKKAQQGWYGSLEFAW
jgi:hypothetical protein